MKHVVSLRRISGQFDLFFVVTRLRLVASLLLAPLGALADGVVSTCTQEELEDAMRKGGRVSFACDGTIVLTNTITVAADVVLDGTGHDVTLSGNNQVRVFEVSPGVSLGLVRLTVANGKVVGSAGLNGGSGFGAGIYNNGGTLNITNCSLTNHQAQGGTGTDHSGNDNVGGAGFGGAIYNWDGAVTLINSTLSGCSAAGGEAIGAPIGTGGRAEGGGIWSSNGTVNLIGTTVRGNKALGRSAIKAGNAHGGGLFALRGLINASNSAFSANVVSGGNSFGLGPAGWGEGGALSLDANTVVNCSRTKFDGNTASAGFGRIAGGASAGGIQNFGTLLLAECELSSNRAVNPGEVSKGGGLFNGQDATLSGTTLVNNVVEGGVGVIFGRFFGLAGRGAGILNSGTLTCTNTTFEGNLAKGGHPFGCECQDGPGQGGALCNENGTAFLVNVTLARNQAISKEAQNVQGGAIFATNGVVTLKNSLLAHGPSGSNCFGQVLDAGHNLSSDGSCAFTNNGSLNQTDPKISLLDDFDGPTRTVALLTGSPALDAADSAECPTRDQRGVTRPFGAGCDIGAFESAPPFSIRGQVLGWQPDGVGISAEGGPAVTSPTNGFYSIHGLASRNYSVTPSGPDRVFQPPNRLVNLTADLVSLDFLSLLTNGLTTVRVNNQPSNQITRFIFAGAPQENYELLSTANLPVWETVTPFHTDNEGLFEFSVTNTGGLGNRMYAVRKP